MLSITLSPFKSHSQLVMLPVDRLVNFTLQGPPHTVWSAEKSAWQGAGVGVDVGVAVVVGVIVGLGVRVGVGVIVGDDVGVGVIVGVGV